jgi:hypothetical protein
LNLETLVLLLADELPAVIFSDDPIGKMPESLPMVLFRFENILKIYGARELGWVAYFHPSVLIKEAMSHPHKDTGTYTCMIAWDGLNQRMPPS